jgi:dTDP-L-rhamnose 4-epimerase
VFPEGGGSAASSPHFRGHDRRLHQDTRLGHREAPKVYEDGKQWWNCACTDVTAANVLAIESRAEGAFNIASPHPHTVGEMAEALADGFGGGSLRPRMVGGGRLGDVRHVFASPEKAERVLGFRARVGFREGMASFATAPMRSNVGVTDAP